MKNQSHPQYNFQMKLKDVIIRHIGCWYAYQLRYLTCISQQFQLAFGNIKFHSKVRNLKPFLYG